MVRIKPRNLRLEDCIRVRNYDYVGCGDYVYAFVDPEDMWLSQYSWHTIRGGYVRTGRGPNGKPALMHRLLLDAPEVDHRDRNKLNNRKRNLRPSDRSSNTQNTEGRGDTPYRGVFRRKLRNGQPAPTYKITYMEEGKQIIPRGTYATPEEAARAYDEHARRIYGPDAFQNGV